MQNPQSAIRNPQSVVHHARVLIRQSDYDLDQLRLQVSEMFDRLAADVNWHGKRVLIKPNFLLAAPPKAAATTHPLVVRAVADYVMDRGGQVRIGDSPATDSFDRVWRVGGYARAFADRPVDYGMFERKAAVDIGRPFGAIDMAADWLEADLVVNLAKLKTHSQMLLTLGVKNLFGCIVGFDKPAWHLRSGIDHDLFARLLVQICAAVGPTLTLIDGILALEGQGPGRSGRPRPLGVLMAGRNPHAVDAAVCRLLTLPSRQLPTLVAAERFGWLPAAIDIDGPLAPVEAFDLPAQGTLVFGPARMQRWMRMHTVQRPFVRLSGCRLCGECWNICPAEAIDCREKQLVFDYDRCIRCYCCIEVCPHGALYTREPQFGRVLRRLHEAWLGLARRVN